MNSRSKLGSVTADELEDLWRAQKRRCGYCPAWLTAKAHVDHILAASRGGTNYRSNLQGLCAPCNLEKEAMDSIEFAQSRGFLL